MKLVIKQGTTEIQLTLTNDQISEIITEPDTGLSYEVMKPAKKKMPKGKLNGRTKDLQPRTLAWDTRKKKFSPRRGYLRRAVLDALSPKRSMSLRQLHTKLMKTLPKVTDKSIAGTLSILYQNKMVVRSGTPGRGFGHKTGFKNGYRYKSVGMIMPK